MCFGLGYFITWLEVLSYFFLSSTFNYTIQGTYQNYMIQRRLISLHLQHVYYIWLLRAIYIFCLLLPDLANIHPSLLIFGGFVFFLDSHYAPSKRRPTLKRSTIFSSLATSTSEIYSIDFRSYKSHRNKHITLVVTVVSGGCALFSCSGDAVICFYFGFTVYMYNSVFLSCDLGL